MMPALKNAQLMIEETKLSYLKALPVFKNIQDKQFESIAHLIKVRRLYSGESINYGDGQSSKIYFVVSGKVKLTELNGTDGELVKDILNEGEVFGDLELEGDPKNFEFAEALTDNTVVCHVSCADFITILQTYPQIAIVYAKRVTKKLKRLEDRYTDLMLYDVRSRLMRFIRNWANIEGSKMGDKIILTNYLTHNDIADMISTSRQTVSILFKEMKDSGLIYYNRKFIQLNDSPKWN
jgi:CRP/FNR family transcriptional regulator